MGRTRTGAHGSGVYEYSYLHEKSGLTFKCKTFDTTRRALHDRYDGSLRRLFVSNRDRGKWTWWLGHHDDNGCVDPDKPFTESTDQMRGPWATMDEAIGDLLWYEQESGGEIGL